VPHQLYVATDESAHKQSWISTHRLSGFFCLAFLLSWYPWVIAMARGRSTGPNPLGPFVAALVIAALAGGRQELKTLLGRLVRVRVGWRWYAFVFAVPVLFCLAAAALTLLLTGWHWLWFSADKLRELPDRLIFTLLFVGLGEEPGWRGFALPALQKKHSPLVASLFLAPVWALWHLPLFGHEFPLPIVAPFVVGLVGATFVQTWLFNRTRGSVLMQMLFHSTVNTVGAGLIFPLFNGTALIVLWWVYAGLWLAAGIVLIRFFEERTVTSVQFALTRDRMTPTDAGEQFPQRV
jgi:membrane protease YdiL (CAAX protease family)